MGTAPSKNVGSAPGVSYVMPVLNEAGYLEAAVASILNQEYAGEVELVLALGPSTDGTAAIVEKLQKRDRRIRIVENHGMDIPIGLNLAIAASRYPVIIRVDAHTELAPGYTAR
ncbi:MAG TPA: glycosyltransferase, partial [Pseudolysinimonas sp.]